MSTRVPNPVTPYPPVPGQPSGAGTFEPPHPYRTAEAPADGPFGNHATLGDGLVSYWALDESSGVRADAVGSNDLTDNNTVGYVNLGPQGVVAQYARATSESLSSSSAALKGNQAFSVAGWVHVTGTTTNMGIFGRDNGAQRDFSVIGNANGSLDTVTLTFYHLNGAFPTCIKSMSYGWHFVVISVSGSGGTMKLVVDDETPVTNTAAALVDVAADFTIGGTAGSGYQDMLSSRFGFWNKVLSADEITSLYNAGLGKSYADLTTAEKVGLVSYWNLDEASGNRADSHGSNTLTDNNTVTSVDNTHPGFGKAASFVAANSEYLSSNPGLGPITGDFTVSAWVNVDNGASYEATDGAGYFAIIENNVPGTMAFSVRPSGRLQFLYWDASPVDIYFTPTGFSGWCHVVTRRISGTVTIWVNGVSQALTTGSTSSGWGDTKTNVGRSYAGVGYYMNDKLAHLGVWNARGLTDQEIGALYNAGAGLFYGD